MTQASDPTFVRVWIVNYACALAPPSAGEQEDVQGHKLLDFLAVVFGEVQATRQVTVKILLNTLYTKLRCCI